MAMSLLDQYLERPEIKRLLLSLRAEDIDAIKNHGLRSLDGRILAEMERSGAIGLPGIVPFQIDNVADYARQISRESKSDKGRYDRFVSTVPCFTPPFPSTWFEWNDPSAGPDEATVNAVHVVAEDLWESLEPDEATAVGERYYLSKLPPGWSHLEGISLGPVRWVLDVFSHFRVRGRVIDAYECLLVLVSPSGELSTVYQNGSPAGAATLTYSSDPERWRVLTLEQQNIRARTLKEHFATALIAIGFTHCKNVSQVESPPTPPDVAAKRRKKLGRPETRFRLLMIDPMRETFERSEGSGEPGPGRSFHICRGYFAAYSEDKPLFGKLTGRFWRQAHTRGHIVNGVVAKHYQVKHGELSQLTAP